MKLVVDGNDGTGKSTLVAALRARGIEVADRGLPTKMTDDDALQAPADELYIVLDAPVEVSRERLARAGKDLNERYHTVEDLTYYRQKFLEVARKLPRHVLIDASGTPEAVLNLCLQALERLDFALPRTSSPPTPLPGGEGRRTEPLHDPG